jgi:hypothetical protein
MTAAKQAYYTAAGPQGSYLLIAATNTEALSRYKALEVARFANEVPGAVGQALVTGVQDYAVKEMEKSKYFESVRAVQEFAKGTPKTPTLVLRGVILDITSDRIPGQKLLDANYLVAVAEVVDKETGSVVAKGNVRGVVKSVAETGETPLAEGMAKGIRKMLKDLLRKTDSD